MLNHMTSTRKLATNRPKRNEGARLDRTTSDKDRIRNMLVKRPMW